jgi:hypothetical protein
MEVMWRDMALLELEIAGVGLGCTTAMWGLASTIDGRNHLSE